MSRTPRAGGSKRRTRADVCSRIARAGGLLDDLAWLGEPPVSDRSLLYAAALLRALGTSLTGVLLGIYLAKLRFDARQMGLVVGHCTYRN